jgi:hypothetical protein
MTGAHVTARARFPFAIPSGRTGTVQQFLTEEGIVATARSIVRARGGLMPRAAISGLLCTTFLIASGVLGRPLGPNLQNVIGRKAGSFPNYDYSNNCPGLK